MQGSFNNVDSNNDGVIERSEFDTLVIVADADSKFCKANKEVMCFGLNYQEMRAIIQCVVLSFRVLPSDLTIFFIVKQEEMQSNPNQTYL